MTRVVIVGEIYNADLSIGGGPMPGGQPGVPTHPIYNPAYPSHPIAPGGPPLGIWGPGFPYPDQGLPGGQPYPGHGLPPFPSHPIAPGGQPPLGMWGPTDPRPTPPIYIPAQPILPDPGDPTKAHIVVYVPGSGAVSFTVDLTQIPEPTPPVEPQPK